MTTATWAEEPATGHDEGSPQTASTLNAAIGQRNDLASGLASPPTISPGEVTAAVETVLREQSHVILNDLEWKPVALIELVERAARLRKAKAEEDQWQAELTHPKMPAIGEEGPIRGTRNAPVTIVEYSDFEYPYRRLVMSDTRGARATESREP